MSEQPLPDKITCPSCGSPLGFPNDGSKTINCSFCGASVIVPEKTQDLPDTSETPDALRAKVINDILQKLAAGNKIEAIKIYRLNFQADLADAKKAVELIEANGAMGIPAASVIQNERKTKIMNAMQQQLLAGNKIEAIKIYRENFDVGLLNAKKAVEDIEAHRTTELPEPVIESTRIQRESMPFPPMASQPARAVNHQKRKDFRRGYIGSALLLAVIVLMIIGVVVFPMLANGQNAGFLPSFIGPIAQAVRGKPALLNPVIWIQADSTSPDIAVQSRRYDTDPYTTALARISPAAGKIVWESTPLAGKDTSFDELYSDGRLIFTVIKNVVQAYQPADGKVIWQAKLSDKPGYCSHEEICIFAQNKVLLVLSADDNVQAFDNENGVLLWQHRTANANNGLYRFKNWVVIFAKDKDASSNYVSFLNVETGAEEYSVFLKDFYGGPKLYFDENSMYLLDRKIEKWDLSAETAKVAWSQDNDQSIEDGVVIQGGGALIATASHSIYAIDKNDGTLKALIESEDFEYTPLSVKDGQVLILSKRTRGTQVSALWVVNLDSGEQIGPIDFGEGKIIRDTSQMVYSADQYVWTYKFDGTILSTVKFLTDPNQTIIESYNLASGEKVMNVKLALSQVGDSDYAVNALVGWQKNVLWVMLANHVMGINAETGKIVFSY